MSKETILEYLKDNVELLGNMVSEARGYDGRLEGYEYFNNDEYFFKDFFGDKIDDAVRAVCYGDYNYMDDYVQFNGYGNLESKSQYEVEEELQENAEEIFDEFIELYEEGNVDVYDDKLEEMLEAYLKENDNDETNNS